MNKVLERQLKKVFGSLEAVPPGFEALLKTVSDTYDHAEEDRLMIERSLEISSKELGELNKKTKEESDKIKTNLGETEHLNTLMIDRELKMIELKKENEELKKKLGL
jgi:two-component system NtrC family sensor kinase